MRHYVTILMAIFFWVCTEVHAQEFSVSSFRSLDNDVTAFITPVFDLADEPCALVRVVGSSDFAFSSPLGIVKRTDLTGEILLYLPKGSKSLTIKHPEWGVMRDYRFTQKLLGQHTYELRISEPRQEAIVLHDTITQTVTDTITVVQTRPRMPLRANGMLTMALMQGDIALGVIFSVMRRHGAYIHPQWNLRASEDYVAECDADGHLADGSMPYYTGSVHRSSYMVTAGAVHRISPVFSIFEGVGWGSSITTWQMLGTDSSALWVKNSDKSHRGVAFEAGTMMSYGRWNASLSVTTVAAKAWCVGIGLGIRIN